MKSSFAPAGASADKGGEKEKMLEWIFLAMMINIFMAFIILSKCRDEQVGILITAMVIAVISIIAATYIGMFCINGVDVKTNLHEGSTYFLKSATYDHDEITLDLQEINVATNELIGPQFLHVRTAPRRPTDIAATGGIIIYQDGEIRPWVSPF
jgi:hypothetical protein